MNYRIIKKKKLFDDGYDIIIQEKVAFFFWIDMPFITKSKEAALQIIENLNTPNRIVG